MELAKINGGKAILNKYVFFFRKGNSNFKRLNCIRVDSRLLVQEKARLPILSLVLVTKSYLHVSHWERKCPQNIQWNVWQMHTCVGHFISFKAPGHMITNIYSVLTSCLTSILMWSARFFQLRFNKSLPPAWWQQITHFTDYNISYFLLNNFFNMLYSLAYLWHLKAGVTVPKFCLFNITLLWLQHAFHSLKDSAWNMFKW